MSADIFHMNGFESNDRAIDIAIPTIAIECEATPPLANYLDAYEVAVLKLVEIGLSTNGISKTLNATESLIESVMVNLQETGYLSKGTGKQWKLTEDGQKYLEGEEEEDRSSNCSQYGYMFVNAIKKEVFPFFLEGDINQVALFRGKSLPQRLTIDNNERKTFSEIRVKKSRLREAYKQFYKIRDVKQDLDDGNITYEEAIESVEDSDLFVDVDYSEDADTFDEAEIEEPETMETMERVVQSQLTSRMFVRPLENSKKNVYLHMRVIIDPSVPGGYRVESPFRMGGIDNRFFQRQIQWMAANDKTKIGDEYLQDYLEREVRKISPSYNNQEKEFDVFVLEKMPLLKSQRYKHGNMYEDMARIYSLMQNQQSLLEKENIVGNISRSVLECLYNGFFKRIDVRTRRTVSDQAITDLKVEGNNEYIRQVIGKTKLDPDSITWSYRFIHNTIGRLSTTKGNSTVEKFINLTVINYYIGTEETDKLFNSDHIMEIYDYTDDLNQIRRKVSHDTDDRFEARDYDLFMSKVFKLINWLLEIYRED